HRADVHSAPLPRLRRPFRDGGNDRLASRAAAPRDGVMVDAAMTIWTFFFRLANLSPRSPPNRPMLGLPRRNGRYHNWPARSCGTCRSRHPDTVGDQKGASRLTVRLKARTNDISG